MEEINPLPFDELYNLKERERISPDLCKLDSKIFEKALAFMESKKKLLQNIPNTEDAERTRKMIERSLDTYKDVLKSLIRARIQKILKKVLTAIESSPEIIDKTNMLDFEKELFWTLYDTLKRYMDFLLTHEKGEKEKNKKETENINIKIKNTILLKIMETIEAFVWKNGKIYGPFEKGDIVALKKDLAEILLKSNKAIQLDIQ